MNRKKKTGVFASAIKQAAATPKPSAGTETPPTRNLLQDRLDSIAKHAASPKVVANQYLTDPENCVLWSGHNRLWDHLNEANCGDLIASFKAVGRQQVAAIARRRLGETPEFEVIAGARRLWVVRYLRERGHPDLKFLVQVKDDLADDVAAFKAMEAENRGRSNLSPYEQGLSYKLMLGEAFGGNQTALAQAAGRDKSTVSRYLQLAEIPRAIIDAFAELSHLSVKQGPKLLQVFTASESNRDLMLREAAKLQQIHQKAKDDGKPFISGSAVAKRLIEASQRRGGARGPLQRFGPKDSPQLEVTSKNSKGFTVFVPHARGASTSALVGHFEEAIKQFHLDKQS